jgi:ketosteroid isomerase-like protein
MAGENADLVRRLSPDGVDLVSIFRGPGGVEALLADSITPDFTATQPLEATTYEGVDGLRRMWLDWLEPWSRYETQIDELIEVDHERVLVLVHDRGRRDGVDADVDIYAAAIWTIRDGKVAHIAFFTSRDEARAAAAAGG